MRELYDILARLCDTDSAQNASNIRRALATVVSTQGSTYRRPGARLLIGENESLGSVSPGCLEDEVIATAHSVVDSGVPRLIQFDTTEEMDAIAGTGLGCRGIIEVFIEPLSTSGTELKRYQELWELLNAEQNAVLAVVVESENPDFPIGNAWLISERELEQHDHFWIQMAGVLTAKSDTHDATFHLQHGEVRVYAERIKPRPKLLVFGGGFDAMPLVRLASEMGFAVSVADHREQYLAEERFPGAHQRISLHPREPQAFGQLGHYDYIVIMTHNYLYDLEILRYALNSDARYIGQIGPKERTKELLEDIESESGTLDEERRNALHAPIGLDLGAESPEEIALSIMSEIMAVHRNRTGKPMRDRRGPIHRDA